MALSSLNHGLSWETFFKPLPVAATEGVNQQRLSIYLSTGLTHCGLGFPVHHVCQIGLLTSMSQALLILRGKITQGINSRWQE